MPDVAEHVDAETDPAPAGARGTVGPPVLPGQPAETAGGREMVRAVRTFCVTGRDPGGTLEAPREGVLPAFMHVMRHADRVQTGEPIVLTHGDGPAASAFGGWLAGAIAGTFGAEAARELRDNAPRLERAARRVACGDDRPGSLAELVRVASEAVIGEIDLHGDPAITMRRDTGILIGKIDKRDGFVTLRDNVPLAVMLHMARRRACAARAAFDSRAKSARDRLERSLAKASGRGGERAAETLSGAFDPAALGRVLGKSKQGTAGMGEERRHRLVSLVEQLDAHLGEKSPPAHVVVRDSAIDAASGDAEDLEIIEAELPCAEAARRFDEIAQRRLPLFLALRVAELEADDAYDPAVHGLYVESFTREQLADDEIATLPAVIAVESQERLCGPDMPHVARALLSGRPIRVLLETEPAANMLAEAEHEPLVGARFEPGVFGLGLRAAMVHQSSVSAIGHMVSGFGRAIDSKEASLHVVATGACEGGVEPSVGRWLHAGAAVDGRANPLFVYDPRPGPSWADRFDFAGNEQAESDWPEHELACVDAVGVERPMPLSFTFADFAVLEPAYCEHYRIIPDDCPTGDLAQASEVIGDAREGDRRIPFVWAADRAGRMHRLAVSRRLIDACRDRLACWRTLQEFAGVHDVYAERAAAGERARATEAADETIAALKAEHAAEIERIRREEAGAVLGRLAESIVGVDLSTVMEPAPRRVSTPPAGAPVETEAGEAPGPAPDEEDDDLGFDDPYIDSPLCTSCNDCLNINKQMFVYNADKQATIGDPDAGTFEQLVVAAEKCPARCIHPGKPRNPDEPGLDGLIERAKKFN